MRIPIRLESKSKYRAKRTDGYASKKEAKRAAELELMEKIDSIRELTKQTRIVLFPPSGPFKRPLVYVADFAYLERNRNGAWVMVIEDCKGFRTAAYKIKKRLVYEIKGVEIRET